MASISLFQTAFLVTIWGNVKKRLSLRERAAVDHAKHASAVRAAAILTPA